MMNEVESPPAPEETHVWVQPRVVKTKKTPVVNFMSELLSPVSGVPAPKPSLIGAGAESELGIPATRTGWGGTGWLQPQDLFEKDAFKSQK